MKKLFLLCIGLMLGGCATTKEYYLGAGQRLRVTSPTGLKLWVNPDASFTIESEDFILGENLIIE